MLRRPTRLIDDRRRWVSDVCGLAPVVRCQWMPPEHFRQPPRPHIPLGPIRVPADIAAVHLQQRAGHIDRALSHGPSILPQAMVRVGGVEPPRASFGRSPLESASTREHWCRPENPLWESPRTTIWGLLQHPARILRPSEGQRHTNNVVDPTGIEPASVTLQGWCRPIATSGPFLDDRPGVEPGSRCFADIRLTVWLAAKMCGARGRTQTCDLHVRSVASSSSGPREQIILVRHTGVEPVFARWQRTVLASRRMQHRCWCG